MSGRKAYLEAHDSPETTFLASAISLKELAVGLHHVEEDPTIADLVIDVGWLDVVSFGPRHAFHAREIKHDCRNRGLPQEQLDALGGDIRIGGTARAEGATVVTTNTTDVQLMPDVRVESY